MTERLAPTVGNLSAMLGGVGIVVGSVAPWATVDAFGFHVSGTSSDGRWTLIVGVAIVLAGLISMTTDWAGWLITGLSLAALAVAIYDLVDISRIEHGASVGWGLILCVASSAVALVGGISEIVEL